MNEDTARRSAAVPTTMEELQAGFRQSSAELAEIREIQRQTAEQMKETDRRMQETDRQIQETDRQMQETDRRMQETRREVEKTARQIRKSEGEFNSKWGRLMESLVEGDLVRLLRERNVHVEESAGRFKRRRGGETMEFDVVALNGAEAVVVEVKTTLRPKHVKRFLDKLRVFKDWSAVGRGRTIYGAMAYLTYDSAAPTFAERQGLFVIRATGSSASIVNAPDFQPTAFG